MKMIKINNNQMMMSAYFKIKNNLNQEIFLNRKVKKLSNFINHFNKFNSIKIIMKIKVIKINKKMIINCK